MPQFFATNRAMEQLGKAVDPEQGTRADRHLLSRGGYYFVNMNSYMRFYLGTTDGERIPREAIIDNSRKTVFEDFLADTRIASVVICVHGFNVELHEAHTWFRILTDTMRHLPTVGRRIVTSPADLPTPSTPTDRLTAFIGFSWPSDGKVFRYSSDRSEAVRSAAPFAHLLTRLKMSGKSVKLVCHSMGNYLACHTLAALIDKHLVPSVEGMSQEMRDRFERSTCFERGTYSEDEPERVTRPSDDWLVDNYVMLAPDVERRHVTKSAGVGVEAEYIGQFYSGLQHLVRRTTNVYSRFDGALRVSDIEKVPRDLGLSVGDAVSKWSLGLLDFLKRNPDHRWEKRLGEAPAPANAAPEFDSLNATELANRKIDHSDHIDSKSVVSGIAAALEI